MSDNQSPLTKFFPTAFVQSSSHDDNHHDHYGRYRLTADVGSGDAGPVSAAAIPWLADLSVKVDLKSNTFLF